MIDVSGGLILLYMCERCECLLWLLNKRYLQLISVIAELENVKEINIWYYFIYISVMYKSDTC